MRKVKSLLAPYSRFLFVLFVFVSIFFFAMFQGGKVSWTIFYILLPFIIYSITLFFYPLSNMAAERIIHTPNVQYGGKLMVTVTLKRNFRFPLLYIIATEKFADNEIPNLAGDKLKHFFVLGFKKEVQWQYEVREMPRGEHIIRGVQIELSDFFGWIRKTHFISIRHTVLVYPKITEINYVPLSTQYERGMTTTQLNIVKDTTMATSVRDYQTGDRMSWIHWKSFARTQNLMTKEFEDRRSQELFLILDGRLSEVFEEQVELTASILKEVSGYQAGIGLVTTGSEQVVFPFIQSEEQLQRAFIHLAKIKPVDDFSINMSSGFRKELQHASTLVLITGNSDWPFIQSIIEYAMNVRFVICFVIYKKDSKERDVVFENIQLAKMRGIAVHAITQEQFPDVFKEVLYL